MKIVPLFFVYWCVLQEGSAIENNSVGISSPTFCQKDWHNRWIKCFNYQIYGPYTLDALWISYSTTIYGSTIWPLSVAKLILGSVKPK